jgi:hypothetical protein
LSGVDPVGGFAVAADVVDDAVFIKVLLVLEHSAFAFFEEQESRSVHIVPLFRHHFQQELVQLPDGRQRFHLERSPTTIKQCRFTCSTFQAEAKSLRKNLNAITADWRVVEMHGKFLDAFENCHEFLDENACGAFLRHEDALLEDGDALLLIFARFVAVHAEFPAALGQDSDESLYEAGAVHFVGADDAVVVDELREFVQGRPKLVLPCGFADCGAFAMWQALFFQRFLDLPHNDRQLCNGTTWNRLRDLEVTIVQIAREIFHLELLCFNFRAELFLANVRPSGSKVRTEIGFSCERVFCAAVAFKDKPGQFVLEDCDLKRNLS